jgi:hypothetical protein
MSRPPVITALLDANVLYPAPLRDYLLYLAGLGVYEPVGTIANDQLKKERKSW